MASLFGQEGDKCCGTNAPQKAVIPISLPFGNYLTPRISHSHDVYELHTVWLCVELLCVSKS